MYEVDFLPVGDTGQSGDAIAMRFTRADTGSYAHVIIDAGFQDDGDALVDHVHRYYETDHIDIAIVTHPDQDHIGGMGRVLEGLNVDVLCVQRLREHGGGALPAADAVDDLIKIAQDQGTSIHEPYSGSNAFGGQLTVLGPDEAYYTQLVADQVREERTGRGAARRTSRVIAAARAAGDRFASLLRPEIRFDDQGGTNPRNNTSVITLITVQNSQMLFTGDAGVPAMDRALDWHRAHTGSELRSPGLVDVPHAGSRHNASSDFLDRLLGPATDQSRGKAQVSVASQSVRHPSPRVANAYMRRGYRVFETRGKTIHHFSNDAPDRPGWVPATELPPMDESAED